MADAPQEEEKAPTQSTNTAGTGKLPSGQQIVTFIDLAEKHPIVVIVSAIAAILMCVATIFGPVNLPSLLPSPTPQPFAPGKPGESLIIVADFEPRPKDSRTFSTCETPP